MKKILLLAAIAGLSAVSCKKSYICECKDTDRIDPFDYNQSYPKMKKKDAEKLCNAENEDNLGLWTCSLK